MFPCSKEIKIQSYNNMFISHLVLQSPVVTGQVLPRRSYFLSEIKRDGHRSRVLLFTLDMPFTGIQAMAQHLVQDTTLSLKIMQILEKPPTHTLALLIRSLVA